MSRAGSQPNPPGTWEVVDKNGKVVQKFRIKTTALQFIDYQERKCYGEELELRRKE